jgi:epoxyqueuosine reductase
MNRLTSGAIKAKALEVGFDLAGIAPVRSFPELDFLREWLARGYAGHMTWLNRTARVRSDVRQIMPEARSVIVTGTLYNTDRPYSGDAPADAPRISRYAWGRDYHDVIGARLDTLVGWMRGAVRVPFEARPYVDTGPVQERVYAQYAGLGWIGKNACLINPDLGSWLFLAVVITSLELESDPEGLEQCGSCTRCLDACPTHALVEPGVLDATRCLSYLTIEHKAAIPDDVRAGMGGQVYGCDICQEVCPYNQPAPVSTDEAWQPQAPLDAASLVQLWTMSDRALRELQQGSAMMRAPLTSLRRNVAVAIGNVGGAEARRVLGMPDSDERQSAAAPMVRDHVAWARGRPAAAGEDPGDRGSEPGR